MPCTVQSSQQSPQSFQSGTLSSRHHSTPRTSITQQFDYELFDSEENKRIFAEDDYSVDVIDVPSDESVSSRPILNTYTKAIPGIENHFVPTSTSSKFFILKPQMPNLVSVCRLNVTAALFSDLLHAYKVPRTFLCHIKAFGRNPDGDKLTSFGGCTYKLDFSTRSKCPVSGYEVCYTVKYPVRTGRISPQKLPLWSIRKTAVYQNINYDTKQASWILVQPSDTILDRLIDYLDVSKTNFEAPDPNPLSVHSLIISAASEGWREYYEVLENKFKIDTKKAINAPALPGVERNTGHAIGPGNLSKSTSFNKKFVETFDISFDDIQQIQRFEETLRSLNRALDLNRDVICALQILNSKLRSVPELFKAQGDPDSRLASSTLVELELEEKQTIISQSRGDVDLLLKNLHGRAQLMYNILEYKNQCSIARQSQLFSQDQIGTKILTILATIYLPVSFVAVVLLRVSSTPGF